MTLIEKLSSQTGERGSGANMRVAVQCLAEPDRLGEISEGLQNKNKQIAADCAEVFTEAAKTRPDLVAPFGDDLSVLLKSKNNRARWEAMHAIALIARLRPDLVRRILSQVRAFIQTDSSVIVRDYAVIAISNFALSGKDAAMEAFPALLETLDLWNGKQAGHALTGLAHVALMAPQESEELKAVAVKYLENERGTVRKAAKMLLKAIDRSE